MAKRAFIDEKTGILSYKDIADEYLKDGYQGTVDPVTGERGKSTIRLASTDEEAKYQAARNTPNFYGADGTSVTTNFASPQGLASTLKEQQASTLQQQIEANAQRQKDLIAQSYQGARSQARTESALSGQRFNESMASKGLSSAGGQALGQTRMAGALQGSLSNLASQEANAKSNIDVQSFNTLLDQLNNEKQMAMQEASLTGTYNGNLTTAEKARLAELARYDTETAKSDALTAQKLAEAQKEQEINNYLATLNRYSADYAKEINNVRNDGDTTNDWQIPYLESARQEKIANQGLDQYGNTIQTNYVPELTSSSALQLWELLGQANESISQALGIPVGTKFSYQSTGGSSGGSSSSSSGNIKDYISLINKAYVSSSGMNEYAIRQYLTNLSASGVDDNTVMAIAQYYGITPTATQTTTQTPTSQGTILKPRDTMFELY